MKITNNRTCKLNSGSFVNSLPTRKTNFRRQPPKCRKSPFLLKINSITHQKNSDLKKRSSTREVWRLPKWSFWRLISIFQNARCTSVHVESLFSVLKAFKADRPNILPETVLKLMFVTYNDNLQDNFRNLQFLPKIVFQ